MLYTYFQHIGDIGKASSMCKLGLVLAWTQLTFSPYEPLAQEERPRTRRASLSAMNMRRSPSASTSRRGISRAESNILTDPTFIPDPEDKLGVKETAGVAVWWGIVWFIGNWLNNTALGLTSVASMTIIATTSGTPLFHTKREVRLIGRFLHIGIRASL
jgi:hypothetical protein